MTETLSPVQLSAWAIVRESARLAEQAGPSDPTMEKMVANTRVFVGKFLSPEQIEQAVKEGKELALTQPRK